MKINPDKESFFGRATESVKTYMKEKITQRWMDAYRAIKTKVGEDNYMIARMTKHSDGILTAFLEYSGLKFVKEKLSNGQDYWYVDADLKKKGLFEEMQIFSNEERMSFVAWLAGNRAEILMEEGRERFFTIDDINVLKTLNRGTMVDARTGINKDRKQVYEKMAKIWEDANSTFIDFGVKTGLFTKEVSDTWQRMWYVPFFRTADADLNEEDKYKGFAERKWKI